MLCFQSSSWRARRCWKGVCQLNLFYLLAEGEKRTAMISKGRRMFTVGWGGRLVFIVCRMGGWVRSPRVGRGDPFSGA